MIMGAFLGLLVGTIAQRILISSIYSRDSFGGRHALSGDMCLFLGAFTAAACVLIKAERFNAAAWFSLAGANLCLIWLSIDRSSQLFHWWSYPPPYKSFGIWNVSKSWIHQFLADALIFNGVPLLWACLLAWHSLKWFWEERKEWQKKWSEQLPDSGR